jgi:hypothetical protein
VRQQSPGTASAEHVPDGIDDFPPGVLDRVTAEIAVVSRPNHELPILSSIWDPKSMSSSVYCWDEEAPQNHRIRTRPNCLVVSLWGHHSGDGQAA